jgi:hypothetical protein
MAAVLVGISLILGITPFALPPSDSAWTGFGFVIRLGILLLGLFLGVASYALCARLMKLKEITLILNAFERKLR